MIDPITHADGMYFNMPFEEYLADPANGSTDIRNLLISPLTYWIKSPMCGWTAPESEAMINGTAFHTRIIEGADAFKAQYAVKPDKGDYPGALSGAAEFKALLKDCDLPVSGTIPELCARIHENNLDAELWPDIMAEFEDASEGKIRIGRELADQIAFRAGIVDRHPVVSKAFRGGYPEVTIIWTDLETGIRCKTRIDYLKTRAIVELKTFSNQFNKPLNQAVVGAIAQRRYHIQAAMHLEAVARAKAAIQAGGDFVYGDAPTDWLKEFMAGNHTLVFVFIETGAVPNVVIREFRTHRSPGEVNFYWSSGYDKFREALEIFARYREAFGEDPWIDPAPMEPLIDESFPIWME